MEEKKAIKNVFISQPMTGKSKAKIMRTRKNAQNYIKNRFPNSKIHIINNIFDDFDGNEVKYLGKAIMEGMSAADIVVFTKGWEESKGCMCEHQVAITYGLECLYTVGNKP